jgi:hypothetical protein
VSELARLLDPSDLDRAEGPRGRITVAVPAIWLAAGATVELSVPSRLVCAGCEGGGCDACGRSGAIRLRLEEEAERTFRFALPRTESERLLVRLVRPLGDDAGLEQLSVEVRAAPEASPGCHRVATGGALVPGVSLRSVVIGAIVALAVAIAAAVGLR